MRQLAIDVGQTIGFASNLEFPESPWEANYGAQHHIHLFELIKSIQPDVLIYERFDHAQRYKVDYTPVEQIGVIKLYSQLRKVELVPQSRSDKQYFTNSKLKHLDYYIPGKPHAMDAVRHLLRYQLRTGEFDINRLKSL